MTVGQNLHQSLTSLKAEQANLESFALETQNQQAQQTYTQCANQLEQVVQNLENRVNYVESEEPQYKVREQMQNQNQQQ